jgi:hypothetical protein
MAAYDPMFRLTPAMMRVVLETVSDLAACPVRDLLPPQLRLVFVIIMFVQLFCFY